MVCLESLKMKESHAQKPRFEIEDRKKFASGSLHENLRIRLRINLQPNFVAVCRAIAAVFRQHAPK